MHEKVVQISPDLDGGVIKGEMRLHPVRRAGLGLQSARHTKRAFLHTKEQRVAIWLYQGKKKHNSITRIVRIVMSQIKAVQIRLEPSNSFENCNAIKVSTFSLPSG